MGTMCCPKALRQALERDALLSDTCSHNGVTEPPPMFSPHTDSAVFPRNLQGIDQCNYSVKVFVSGFNITRNSNYYYLGFKC